MSNLDNSSSEASASVKKSLIKRLGFYGFMFFLIKGLLWLIVPALMVYFGYEYSS